MSRTASLNGEFEGAPPWRPADSLPPLRDAYPGYPRLDPAEVAECRRLGGRLVAATVREIEGYPATSAEELGAQRDLELWGCNPFEEG